jgi:hypothetical protein
VPLVFRKIVVDFIEVVIPSLLVLNATNDPFALVNAVLLALGSAAISAIRRNITGLNDFARDSLDVPRTEE